MIDDSPDDLEAFLSTEGFDPDWYLARYPDVAALGFDAAEHFIRFGRRLGRSSSAEVEAREWEGSDVRHSGAQELAKRLLRDKRIGDPVWTVSDGGKDRHQFLSSGLEAIRRHLLAPGQNQKHLLGLEALLMLRLGGATDEVHRLWDTYWKRSQKDSDFASHPQLRLPNDQRGNVRFPLAQRNTLARTSQAEAPRYCVYTALYGDYDDLSCPLYRPPGLDFLCFTDSPGNVPGWKYVTASPAGDDPVINSRYIKMLPHRILPDYDYSLYLDSNHLILADVFEWTKSWLAGNRFVGWAHAERSDIYNELEAILLAHRHEPHSILAEHQHYLLEGVPTGTGLLEAAILWRSHRDEEVIALMEAWWRCFSTSSKRDQPVLSYQMWKTGVLPAVLPPRLGNARESEFTVKVPHKSQDQRGAERACSGLRFRPHAARQVAWLYRREA